jgi:DNA-binding beta-propeller fold protein YncE
MRKLLALLPLTAAIARAGILFLGAYPDSVIVFDESKGQIVDRIHLETGLPTSLRLSHDKKTIFVTTNDHAGLEVIDVATHKVLNHFVLDNGNKRFRFNGGVPDPEGKLLYAVTTEITKQIDRFEIAKPKYTVIDIPGQKIARTVDMAPEDERAAGRGGGRGGGFQISPDGKFLYQFRDTVVIMNSSDFKVLDRLPLSKPDLPGMESISFGGQLDSIAEPGMYISTFNSSDPVVHARLFGIGRFDLNTRKMDFSPIGPSPTGMAGLQIAPDKKAAYTVVANGVHGNRRCEFWAFDLNNNHLGKTVEVPCRTRFSFGMSADGKKLYIYGAGYDIEVYDAATLKLEHTWDLNNDTTMAGMVVLP